ncbi:MAG: 23S rRNA (adenine(2503)-C(2))-methyltransferase RlmN [Bdellovibrionaceae bacterium]|nr:23S rRNA (adenine(2503)-C(2))-methyltransferase RlmN [Pseudobdellovibrionaceae bacterium]
MEKHLFFNHTHDELADLIKNQGKEKFRAHQLFKWVYEKKVLDPEKMSNLAKDFRSQVPEIFDFSLPKVVSHLVSQDGTQKFLFEVDKGLTFEAVLIPASDRNTLCISSEVGCNMACTFCFTGKQKLKRRLSAGEIVGQYMQVVLRLDPEVRITNIVFMGMGEPLDNWEGVGRSIQLLHDPRGLNLSRKRITVSTSGLAPQIPLITESGARLAVSLNDPNDEIRDKIMPINKKYPLAVLMEACREHTLKTRDRVTFEYVMLKDLNDEVKHALEVRELVRNFPCKINLIPFNEHPDSGFVRPESKKVYRFQEILLNRGFHTTIRRTMGRDIFAACGQLTSVYQGRPTEQTVATGVLG